MAVVYIPALLQGLTGGRSSLEVEGATVRQIVENLDAAWPGIAERLMDDVRLRPNISVAVDGEISPMGLLEVVAPGSEVHFVAAIKGGAAREDRRLVELTKICAALPEATRELHASHASFRVRRKIFAYFLNDHNGDGIVAISCKVLPGDNAALVSSDPHRFYLPAYIGPRGWVALRLDVGEVDWEEVAELVTHSYRLTAPKRLASSVTPVAN